MDQAIETVFNLILTLLGLILAGVVFVEHWLRGVLQQSGVSGQTQGAILVGAAILLMIVAFRIFGGLLGILITVFMLLLIAHVVAPGMLDGLHSG